MHETLSLGEFIASRGSTVNLRPGQTLFHEGDRSTSVYACVSGRINLFITTPVGREVMLGFKVPTQAFGELSAIDGGRRSASAVSIGSAVVAQMPGEEFLDQLSHEPALSIVVLRELAEHVRRLNERLSGSTNTTTERVGQLLLELEEKFRRHSNSAGQRTELPVTQDEVAAWVGATREATARSLGDFRRGGAIETGRNKILIIDPRLLKSW
jgi:CRP/FNR family transcriptional regulator, cyclic AMP receptor protein